MAKQGVLDDIVERFRPIARTSGQLNALGQAELARGNAEAAMQYSQRALDERPECWRCLVTQAMALVQPDWVQLHGEETDAHVMALGPQAYKAVGLANASHVEHALRVPGHYVLIDARDEVLRGGIGRAPPASLACEVCKARPTILAGGLGADNVAAAIAAFRPAGVDAASRLEVSAGKFGKKSPELVHAFVQAARGAFARLGSAHG
jgi:phosphoribosylanthranilate isomerase